MISDRGHVHVVPTSTVVWAEAADNYVIIYTEDKQYMLRQTMSGLHERLRCGLCTLPSALFGAT